MRGVTGILLFVVSVAWGSDAAPDRIRNAAARGLALIQSTQKDWFTKQSCNSCHQQILPAPAVRAAREHGVPLNDDAARAHAQRVFAFLSRLGKAVQYNKIIDPTMDGAYQLQAAYAEGVAPNLTTSIYVAALRRVR